MEYINETEQKIIAAATEVFLEKGKTGARMEEIARMAGINQALLHYYFRSKDRLYHEVFSHELKKVMPDLFNALDLNADMQNFMRSFIYNYIDRIHHNPKVPRFFLWETREGGENIKKILDDVFSLESGPVPETIIRKIQGAVKNNEIRQVDPYHLMISLIGMCVYSFIATPILSVLFPKIDFNDAAFIEKRKEQIFHLAWNGVKP